jgi:hypothetical protein
MKMKKTSTALILAGALLWLSAPAQSVRSSTNDSLTITAGDSVQLSAAPSALDTNPTTTPLSADTTRKLPIIKRHHSYRAQVRYGLSTMAFIAIMITLSQAYNPE